MTHKLRITVTLVLCLAHFGTIDVLADGSVDDDYQSTSVECLRSGAASALAAARFVEEHFPRG